MNLLSTARVQGILREQKDDLRVNWGVQSIGLFGSYARGEQNAQSDVDLLVEFNRSVGFFEFLKLEEHLGGLLGAKVDLVTRKALKPHIGRHILDEVIMI